MSHSYLSNHVHIVFSTKERVPSIKGERGRKLLGYIGGVAKHVRIDVHAIGGMEDHVHMLVSIPGDLSIAKAVNLLKSNSSKWMNEHKAGFAWQSGYGAFSVSASNLDSVRKYIENQAEHHKKRNFEEEFVALLKKHNVDYDPKYMLG